MVLRFLFVIVLFGIEMIFGSCVVFKEIFGRGLVLEIWLFFSRSGNCGFKMICLLGVRIMLGVMVMLYWLGFIGGFEVV